MHVWELLGFVSKGRNLVLLLFGVTRNYREGLAPFVAKYYIVDNRDDTN